MKRLTAIGMAALIVAGVTCTANGQGKAATKLEERLKQTVLQAVDFREADLRDALTYFEQAAGAKQPVNFVLVPPKPNTEQPRITLKLTQVSLYDAVRYTAAVTDSAFRIDDNAIVVTPADTEPASSYHVDVKVAPAGEPKQYMIEFRISETQAGGKTNVLSAPRIVTLAGQEGRIQVSDGEEQSGIFCTAQVNEKEDGIEAVTSVEVKEGGKTLWSNSQSTTVKK